MKCPSCDNEISTETLPPKATAVTLVCQHCGCQMEVEKRPLMGWKWPKVTPREKKDNQ